MAEQVQCLHLLCKSTKSRNPVSRRTNATITMTEEEAIQEINGWLEKINSGSISFEDAARQRSDCGSYAKGGDLGMFGRGAMQKPFEEASFALKVGEMTQKPVISDSGVHLIKRIA